MTNDVTRTIDRMLEKDWYHPTNESRAAADALVLNLVQAGFDIPRVGATRWKGTQCDWESRAGFVIVCFDDNGRCSLVVGLHGEDDATCINLPTTAQIVTALQTI